MVYFDTYRCKASQSPPYGLILMRFTMQRLILAIAFLGTSVTFLSAQEGGQTPPVNFVEHVLPIFRQHCLQCHNANDAEAGLAIDSYGALMEGGGSGDVVSAGDAMSSRLFLVMTHDEEPAMPPNQDPIPAEQLDIIKRWIEGGLLENSGSKAKKRKGPSLSFSMSEDGKPEQIIMPESVWRVPVVSSQRAAAATAIAASPWAPLVAVAGQRQVSLYHTESNDLLGVLPYPEGIPQVLRFNRDGGYLLVAGGTHSSMGTASLYDIRTGSRLMSVGDELDVVFGADINDSMTRVALGGPQKMVRIFDTDSGEAVFELKKHTDWVYCVDYSPDGVLVASGDRAGGLHVWEAETGRLYLDLIGHKGAVRSLIWRADSNVLLSASEDGTVKMWEMTAGNQLKSFNAHSGGVTGIAMAQDGKIVTSGKDKTVKVWNADGSAVATMPAFDEPALEVAITHDSSRVIGGDWNGRTLIWQIADPKLAAELSANPPTLSEQVAQQTSHLGQLTDKKAKVSERYQAGKQLIATYLENQKTIEEQISQAKVAMKSAQDGKVSSENKIKSIQSMVESTQQKVKELQQKVSQLDQQMASVAANQASIQQQMNEAASRKKFQEEASEKIKQSVSQNVTEQEKLKNGIASEFAMLSKQETELRAKLQLAKAKLNDLNAIKAKHTEELQTGKKVVVQAQQLVEQQMKQLQEYASEKAVVEKSRQDTLEAISMLTQMRERNDAERESLNAKLQAETDEGAQAVIRTQLTKLEEVDSETTKKIEQANLTLKQAEVGVQKITETIKSTEAAKLQQEKELLSHQAKEKIAETSLKEAANDVQLAEAAYASVDKEKADFDSLMSTAQARKNEVVLQVASLLSEKGKLDDALKTSLASVESESKGLNSLMQDLSKMTTDLDSMKAAKIQMTQQIATENMNLSVMNAELQELPKVIEAFNKQIAGYQNAIPNFEAKLADAVKAREESSKMLEAVQQELTAADASVQGASAKLSGLQDELVRFESTSSSLQDEAKEAFQKAEDHRQRQKPLEDEAGSLATSISERDQKIKTVADEIARIQMELKGLEQMQTQAKASYDEAVKKLDESNAVYVELEAAEQETRERLKFFESAYGI